MDLPTDIILGKIPVSRGKGSSLPFFAGSETECVQRRFHGRRGGASAALGGTGKIRDARRTALSGLRQCPMFPPKTLPVSFDVKVVREPATHHANPAQSPHVHN